MTCILNMCIPLSVRILLAHLHGLCTLLSNDQYPHVMNENEDLHNARDVYNRYSFTHTPFFFTFVAMSTVHTRVTRIVVFHAPPF